MLSIILLTTVEVPGDFRFCTLAAPPRARSSRARECRLRRAVAAEERRGEENSQSVAGEPSCRERVSECNVVAALHTPTSLSSLALQVTLLSQLQYALSLITSA